LRTIIARAFLYILLAAAAAQLALIEVRHVTWRNPFHELGFVEIAQSLLLAASAILLFWMGHTRRHQAQLASCAALAMTILLIRENDYTLELFLPHGAWKWLALPVAGVLVWQCIRHRNALKTQLRSFSSALPFGVYLAGGSTLLFSRLFGNKVLWEAVMSERYFRAVKNAVQEGIELFALGLFFCCYRGMGVVGAPSPMNN